MQTMKKILFVLLLLTAAPGFAQETFRLETGDLLFQVNGLDRSRLKRCAMSTDFR